MPFDPVPWFVEGGAEHSAEVARTVAFLATGGQEGIVSSTDFRVQALAVPGPQIRVLPGAGVVRNRALGGANQSYVLRAADETVLDVNPTSSAGPRSDLVVARVENPHISGEPWQQPGDVAVGPYVFPRIIEGVASTTRSVHELNLGYSAITLARIDLPVSTGTVTAATIVDLRSVCNPTTGTQPPPGSGDGDGEAEEPDPVVTCPGEGDDGDNDDGDPLPADQTDYFNWPTNAVWNIKIPEWANYCDIEIRIYNCQIRYGSLGGYIRLLIAGLQMVEGPWRVDWPSDTARQTISRTYRDVVIPENLRGTTVQWRIQNRVLPGFLLGLLLATQSTQVKMAITFKQKAG